MEAAAAFLHRDRAVRRADLLVRFPFSAPAVETAAQALVDRGDGLFRGDFVVEAAGWETLRQRAAAFIDRNLRQHPEHTGLPIRELRRETQRNLPAPELFDALVADLVADGKFIRSGAAICRATHRPSLPLPLRAAGERLRAALAAKPFEPPSRKELAADAVSLQALRFLCETGEAVALGESLVLLAESYQRIKGIIIRTIRAAGPATASELRQVIGTTRRVMIPVLEALDKEGITLRDGDRRGLK